MLESITRLQPAQANGTARCVDVSVIIVSWNVRELLFRCLEALQSPGVRGGLQVQVIVVDNASSDGSAEAAEHFPGVEVVRSRTNLGYGKANNLGLRGATGRYILVLNPDTVPQPGSLAAMVAFAECNPRAGIVSPRLLNLDGTVQPAAFRFPTLLMVALDLFPPPVILPGGVRLWLWNSRLNGRYPSEARATKPFRIDHPLGACMLLRSRAYEEIGGFNQSIFMYAEEIDLALRYRRAGWECWQVPAARVVHLGGASTRQIADRMFVELWRSRIFLYSRYYAPWQRVLLETLLMMAQVRDVLCTLLLRLSGRLPAVTATDRLKRARAITRLVLGL